MRAGETRTERLGVAIFGLLIAILLLRAFVDTPGLSLVFLAVFPIVLAAFVLGRTAAVACTVLATVLSVVVPIIKPGDRRQHGRADRRGDRPRAVFIGLALVVSGMHARQTQLRSELEKSERELTELVEPARRADRPRAARARRPSGRHLLYAGEADAQGQAA